MCNISVLKAYNLGLGHFGLSPTQTKADFIFLDFNGIKCNFVALWPMDFCFPVLHHQSQFIQSSESSGKTFLELDYFKVQAGPK